MFHADTTIPRIYYIYGNFSPFFFSYYYHLLNHLFNTCKMKFISALTIALCAVVVSAAPHGGDTDVEIHDQSNNPKSQINQYRVDKVANGGLLGILGINGIEIPVAVLSPNSNNKDDRQQAQIIN
ncbi:uncharacterized protein EV154DRAFT_523378 [Mucor mucedo]|uniref:uncharacterized protein n=1 Tax=Mucor mucedo TaxID=29922 RepID=UPI00222000CD|nr:uncharacterized protein EV154DRAFT_523378 [Mucor mucedo]KAI7881497.1 hypothetical protein EV154DRAFT_523378 [Mucor mucedo]